MPDPDIDAVFGSGEDNNPYTADSVTLARVRRGKSAATETSSGPGPGTAKSLSTSEMKSSVQSLPSQNTVPERSESQVQHEIAPAFSSTSEHTSPQPEAIVDGVESDSESLLLYSNPASNASPEASKLSRSGRVSQILAKGEKPTILISEAGKSNEGLANASKRYVVYTIKLISGDSSMGEIETRRRYSDFVSLRDTLTRVFPLLMIPPIPPKNYFSLNILSGFITSGALSSSAVMPLYSSVSGNSSASPKSDTSQAKSYPYINSNHLSKIRLVEHRKRLLANFLNNCLSIPRIRKLDFFAKFLDPAANWSDEIALISSQLPTSIYQSNPENGLSTDSLYANLPLPVSGSGISLPFQNPLRSKKPSKSVVTPKSPADTDSIEINNTNSSNGALDADFNQKYSSEYSIIRNSQLDDINKSIIDSIIGLSLDYAEFGAALNSFSVTLSDSSAATGNISEGGTVLSQMIDAIGLAYENSSLTINGLIGDLETKYSEPLGEAFKFASVYESTKSFKKKKEKQKKLVDQELSEKKRDLADCVRTELEVTKIENGIQSQSLKRSSSYKLTQDSSNLSVTRQSSGFGSKFMPRLNAVKKISKYVSDIMDQNPELTRKQRLTQLQERVSVLEKCQKLILSDIAFISNELDANAKEFRNNELKSIIKILLNYNKIFTSWASKNMQIWEGVKEEINRIFS